MNTPATTRSSRWVKLASIIFTTMPTGACRGTCSAGNCKLPVQEFEQSLTRRGVIHSFTSGPGLAKYALDQGWCLGFNGITTFNKAENVRDIVRMSPIDQILLETDAPFLTPVPYRGRENAPFYLPFVAEKIAEVKDLPLDEVLTKTYENSLRTFFPAR